MSLAIDPSEDDLLLTASEILESWEISNWKLRTLVKNRQLRRVRRPAYQPYYPLSAVVAVLGNPIHDPRPRKHSGFELAAAA